VTKRVKFEFDEASLKTLEQLQEMGVETVDIPPREAYFGCDGSPSERHRSHVSQQLASRDAQITELLHQNMQLNAQLCRRQAEWRQLREWLDESAKLMRRRAPDLPQAAEVYERVLRMINAFEAGR
jgi:hypothetical protein